MPTDVVARVQGAVHDALAADARVLLAVSGGLDSMCLLDAAAAVLPRERLVVATFDHGTGACASAASALASAAARALEIPVHAGRGTAIERSEAAWRAARWEFLRATASAANAVIATAHTRDDQVETVLLRVLRDAGARGLAGLYARSPVRRPLLETGRDELRAYAAARGVRWIEDPSNVSPEFLRNRLRHELLPAMRRAHPTIDDELLVIARRAAEWREDVETIASAIPHRVLHDGAGLDVARDALTGYSRESLAVLWPALVARVGLALDRRGTNRLVAFTTSEGVGRRIQLSGGWDVIRGREQFQLRRRVVQGAPPPTELSGDTAWGRWRFRVAEPDGSDGDRWTASLPADRRLSVRSWRPGDALVASPGRRPRKVKRLLSSAGITGFDRRAWPVVLAGDEIVWIPGVRRSDAATVRSGRPGPTYRCEFDDR